jgi:16S rRNA (guanine527-N7)-methyltransferase
VTRRSGPAYGPGELARDLDVSRETLGRLVAYEALIRRWQPTVNLIGAGTLGDLWRRHFLDCGQLTRHLPAAYDALYDVGTGAGFPGLVLALLGAHDVTLIESDARKCAFLREAARATGAAVTVLNARVEVLDGR